MCNFNITAKSLWPWNFKWKTYAMEGMQLLEQLSQQLTVLNSWVQTSGAWFSDLLPTLISPSSGAIIFLNVLIFFSLVSLHRKSLKQISTFILYLLFFFITVSFTLLLVCSASSCEDVMMHSFICLGPVATTVKGTHQDICYIYICMYMLHT